MSKKIRIRNHHSGEKYLTAFMLGFFVFIFSILPVMIAEKGYFIYTGDYNSQQIPFYNLANDAVRSGQFGWNWYTDLGTDFITSYSFYLFGSPFFWLSTLLPRAAVTFSMPFLLALKHGFASLTAYAYIRRFVRSKNSALTGALLYTFSGFQIFNIFFNHFQDVTAFFPLMLIAMEENINNRRKGVFALTVALMAAINYYFFAGQAVFLVIYYLFRMKSPDFNTSWKKFAGLVFEAVIGTLIAAVILLPSALAIMGNERITQHPFGIDAFIYSDNTLIPRIIQTFFMCPDAPASPNLFCSDHEKWASIGGYLPLFSMAGVAAFMKTRKKHWATRLSVCCIIFAFVPVLNSLFQAFNSYYYARWFYMPILIFAMMTAQSLDDEETDLAFGWKLCAAVLAAFVFIGIYPTKSLDGKPLFLMLPFDLAYYWIVMAVAVACLIASAVIFSRRKKHKSFRRLSVIMTSVASIICILTMVLYSAVTISNARLYIDADLNGGKRIHEEVSEDNFFRADMSENCDNMPMFWKIPSMRAFQSVVNPSIMAFYDSVGVQRDVASRADVTHYTLRGLFSVKYYYRELHGYKTYEEIKSSINDPLKSQLASAMGMGVDMSNLDITEEMPGFEYIGDNGYYEIYENKLFVPMGFAYDSYVPQDTADKKNHTTREQLMMKSLVLTDSQIEKYSDILTENTALSTSDLNKDTYVEFCKEKQQNCSSSFTFDSYGFESEITLSKPQLVFFSVPFSEGWTAEVNGKAADIEKVSYGFMAVRAEEGTNTIVFKYRTPGLTAGMIISLSAIIILVIYIIICRRKGGKTDIFNHTHYYDYTSCKKISASQEYCDRISRKK